MPKLILSSKEVTTSFAETTAPKPKYKEASNKQSITTLFILLTKSIVLKIQMQGKRPIIIVHKIVFSPIFHKDAINLLKACAPMMVIIEVQPIN